MDKHIEISLKTILMTAGLFALLYLLIQIKEVILLIFVALILAVALEPAVAWLKRRGFKRGLAVIIVVLLIMLLLIGVVALLITPIVTQTQMLIEQFPRLLDVVFKNVYFGSFINTFNAALTEQLTGVSGSLLKITLDVFTAAASLLTVLFFTAYLLLDMPRIKNSLLASFSKETSKETLKNIWTDLENRLGGWIRGELVLMTVVGLSVFVGLTLLQVSFAVPLAVLAGVLEIMPVIGPVVSAVPAIIVGFAISPLTGLGVLGLFILVQQVENNFIVPRLMKTKVGLNPVVTIFVLAIGAKLGGVMGTIMAIPSFLAIESVLQIVIEERKNRGK